MYRRLLILSSVILVVLLAVNLSRLVATNTQGQSLYSNQVTPYTVVLLETVTDANGVSHTGTQLTQAVRQDGSSMRRLGNANTGGREIYLAQGMRVVTKPRYGMKSTVTIKGDVSSHQPDPRTQCTQDLSGRPVSDSIKILGEESVAGYRTVKLDVNGTITWQALDFGCAPVRYIMDFGSEGKSEMNLILLTKGEPDSSLFRVPKEYQEVKPSVAFCGGECPPGQLSPGSQFGRKFQRLDAEYVTSKSR